MISFDNISFIIVTIFLLLTFLVGCYFSRQKTTFREYAIGNKQFGTATLTATVLATSYGAGGLIRGIDGMYQFGLWWVIFYMFSSFGLCIISKLALRMGPFMHDLSVPQTIGNIYGKYPKIISALFSTCSSMVIITIQIKLISKGLSICLGRMNSNIVTIFVILVLIFYSTFGGIRSITFTSVLQFITLAITIPLLSWFLLLKLGKPIRESLIILQGHDHFRIDKMLHLDKAFFSNLLILISFIICNIDQALIQKVYMSSSPIQARKVFSNAFFFSIAISFFIILAGLFVFISAPYLPKEAVWSYVTEQIPTSFKPFLSLAILSMAISTADVSLNCCSVVVTNDILKSLQNKKYISDSCRVKLARYMVVLLGLLSTIIAFLRADLRGLILWFINFSIPITIAPFILALFGFRGTSRTTLIGMFIGLITLLVWNTSVKPLTNIDGSVVAMLSNGLAMMAAHYSFKQPEGTGWVEPDNTVKQLQQEKSRKYAAYREAINHFLTKRKALLSKFIPSNYTIVSVGIYFTLFNLLSHFIHPTKHGYFGFVMQLLLGAYFMGYPFMYDVWHKVRSTQRFIFGIIWLLGLTIYLPFNLIWHLLQHLNPIFTTGLSLAHSILILSVLPIYLGIVIVTITLLVGIYFISVGCSYEVLYSLLPLFIFGILICLMVIYLKVKISSYTKQIIYLKNHEKIRAAHQIKSAFYESAIVPFNHAMSAKGHSFVLKEVVRKVQESISFLDNNKPLFKEDFQAIINKLYDWIDFFKRKEQAKHHALLSTTKISLEKLIRNIEIYLAQQTIHPPRILVEKIRNSDQKLFNTIVCDVHQITYAITKAILRIATLEKEHSPIMRIQFHPTAFQFKQADNLDNSYPDSMSFQGIAILISRADTDDLPKVKKVYSDLIDSIDIDTKIEQTKGRAIDIDTETLSSVVHAHYGYLEESPKKKRAAILIVLPVNVTHILDKINIELPLDTLPQDATPTLKEEADAMVLLMKFHDDFCKQLNEESPADLKMISASILLLRQYFRFKRHASGQLFYVRAIGIAQLVAEWAFNYHKVICAALLYELVRHNCLPLSYIKKHYNIGIYGFVSNLVKIDAHQDLAHPSLLYIQNRFEEAIKENNVQISVLSIKLAERLYDLRHAKYYTNPKEIVYMAQETLAIDVQIANTYLDKKIAIELEETAKGALKICNNDQKSKKYD